MPEISVVTPAYNAADFVAETIESLRSQEISNWEHIVVNDGSVDQTAEVVTAVSDGRLRLISQENQGQSAAQNRGIAEARAPFLVMLDADDRLLPGALERLLQGISLVRDAVLAFGGTQMIDEAGDGFAPPARQEARGPFDPFPDLLVRNPLTSGGAAILRTEAMRRIGGYDADLVMAQDWECWCRLALEGQFVQIGGPPVLQYRLRTGSVSRLDAIEPERQAPAMARVFGNPDIAARVGAGAIDGFRRRREALVAYLAGTEALRARGFAQARRHLWRSLRARPFHAKAWMLLLCAAAGILPGPVARRIGAGT